MAGGNLLFYSVFSSESFCTDINGNNIKNGASFVPKPKEDNFCLHCTCTFGQAKDCIKAECAIPTCKNYKPVSGKCCAYTCPSGNKRKTTC